MAHLYLWTAAAPGVYDLYAMCLKKRVMPELFTLDYLLDNNKIMTQ